MAVLFILLFHSHFILRDTGLFLHRSSFCFSDRHNSWLFRSLADTNSFHTPGSSSSPSFPGPGGAMHPLYSKLLSLHILFHWDIAAVRHYHRKQHYFLPSLSFISKLAPLCPYGVSIKSGKASWSNLSFNCPRARCSNCIISSSRYTFSVHENSSVHHRLYLYLPPRSPQPSSSSLVKIPSKESQSRPATAEISESRLAARFVLDTQQRHCSLASSKFYQKINEKIYTSHRSLHYKAHPHLR